MRSGCNWSHWQPDRIRKIMPTGAGRSTALSSGCGRVASGTNCRASSGPRVRSMTGSSAGAKAESCNASGRYSPKSATTSGPWTGNGRLQTDDWAKPGSGGKKVGKNPTDRGKNGSKESLLVDGEGGPLSAVLAAANVN